VSICIYLCPESVFEIAASPSIPERVSDDGYTTGVGTFNAMSDPAIQSRFAADGSEVEVSSTPAEFEKLVSSEIARWVKFTRTSGFKSHL
jgi:tripartite-type tricarboxylate transporter receptor subunit TctC